MAEYLSPGVYVEEFDSGLKPMEGVSTSTAGFVGVAERGPLSGIPQFIGSFSDYQRKFGGYLKEADYGPWRYLPNAVEQFFSNGGSRCYVVRVLPGMEGADVTKKPAKASWQTGKDGKSLIFQAANEGVWGNRLTLSFTSNPSILAVMNTGGNSSDADSIKGRLVKLQKLRSGKDLTVKSMVLLSAGGATALGSLTELGAETIGAKPVNNQVKLDTKSGLTIASLEFDVTVCLDGEAVESYRCLTLEDGMEALKKVFAKSEYITVEGTVPEDKTPLYDALMDKTISLAGGRDCADGKKLTEMMDIGPFKGTDKGPGKRSGIPAFKDVPDVSILLAPGLTDLAGSMELVTFCENQKSCFCILDMPKGEVDVNELKNHRSSFDSSYAAMYHPWIQVYDPLEKKSVYMPPSGAVAGIYARSDNTRGVHKAPANEVVRNCTGLETLFGKAEQDMLNPEGINLIRNIQGQGIRVWGARTCSSDGSWKYINVRRLFIFIEQSIYANTGWAVFEPNDQILWSKVEGSISSFLRSQWRNGALAGKSEEEAYFINIGLGSSMTQDDILNGRMICVIGVAPVRPAEFIIFRITQIMESES